MELTGNPLDGKSSYNYEEEASRQVTKPSAKGGVLCVLTGRTEVVIQAIV